MADYLVMALEDEQAHASQPAKAMAQLIEESAAYADDLRAAGHLLDHGRFRPSKEGKRLRREGERLAVRGGPFAEDGKALGGYYCVQASSLDEAAGLAARAPALASDAIDVRPVMKRVVPPGANRETLPGKIFGCAVLGSAPTEDAWVAVMNRIDKEGSGSFPAGSFLGGIRLEPPTTGRRIAMRGEKRATFDGPFLESKEVIGGLFLVRMASLDEVVEWAGDKPFLAYGGLEIRELWRT